MFIITLDDPNGIWKPRVEVYGDNGWVEITESNYNKADWWPKAKRITSLQDYGSSEPAILYQSDHPENTDYLIVSPTLKVEKGKAGTLEFTMLPGHPYYDKIFRLRSIVRVFQKAGNYYYELQKCRVTEIEIDVTKQKKITCQGDLAYLGDSIQPPRTGVNDSHTPKSYFQLLIANHINANTGGIYINPNYWTGHAKEFTIGKNQLPSNVSHSFKNTSYNTTESIIENLMASYGGYLRTRTGGWVVARKANGDPITTKIDGKTYSCYREFRIIDYLKDREIDAQGNIKPGSDEAENKNISYGVNLIDLNVTWTSDEYFNTLVPTGDSVAGAKGSGSALPLTLAADATTHGGVYLTIGDVINAHKGSGDNAGESDAFANAIGRFTRIVRTENFSGVKKADELLKKAQEFMKQNYKESPETYTVTAIDNFDLGTAQKPIFVGDIVHLDAKASHGIDVTKECTSIQYDLTNPAGTEFELGEERKNLSDQFKDETKSSSGRSSSKSGSSASSDTSDGGSTEQGNDNTQAISEKTSKSSVLSTIFGNGTGSALDGVKGLLSFDGGDIGSFVSNNKIDIGAMIAEKLNPDDYIPSTALDEDPTIYPSVDVDDDGKVFIGRTWGSTGPNFFEIADTATFKNMKDDLQRRLRVSAENISLSRRYDEDDEGQGSLAPDYKSTDGNVYLPATVRVTQDGNTIVYVGRIEIEDNTYLPSVAYEKEVSTDTDKKLVAKTRFAKTAIPTEVYIPTIATKTISGKTYHVASTQLNGTVIGESDPIEVSGSSANPTDLAISKRTRTISPTTTVTEYWFTGKVNGVSQDFLQVPTAVYTPTFVVAKRTSGSDVYVDVKASTKIASSTITATKALKTWLYDLDVNSANTSKALRSPHAKANVGSVKIKFDAQWKITNGIVVKGSKEIAMPVYLFTPRFARSRTTFKYYEYSETDHTYTMTAYTGNYNNKAPSELATAADVFRQASKVTGTEAYDAGVKDGKASATLEKYEGPGFTPYSAGDAIIAELQKKYTYVLGNLTGMGQSGLITFKVKVGGKIRWCRFGCS